VHDGEIDHTEPYTPGRPGQSNIGNYGPLTAFHHRLKTHGRWQVKQPWPGICLWRDGHGATYLVDHTGTRRVNRAAQVEVRTAACRSDYAPTRRATGGALPRGNARATG
jgi:hypothetical protein